MRDRLTRIQRLARKIRGEVVGGTDSLLLAKQTAAEGPLQESEIEILSLNLRQVDRMLEAYIGGDMKRSTLLDWVDEMLRISLTLDLSSQAESSLEIESALGVLTLILDDDFASPDSSRRLSMLLLDKVRYRGTIPCRRIVSEMFREMGSANLAVQREGSETRNSTWADFCLLPRNRQGVVQPLNFTTGWFKPLSVSTIDLWQQISPGEYWTQRENDLIPDLLSAQPALERRLRGLQIFIDPGGLTEAVVDSETLTRRELRQATLGFCSIHRMNRCFLDGFPVHSRKEDL